LVFNSLTFVAFFAIVLLIYSLPFGWTGRKIFLLVASYAFYSA
jgi:alginate O-acetyltransferase complex protein AlgI